MRTYWCELAWLGGEAVERGVAIEVEGERIAAVRTGVGAPPEGAKRFRGVTLPGLANVHSHAFQRVMRGRTEGGRGSFWTWREMMYGAAGALDPDTYMELARATFGEMALAGITAVGEFHYVHHGPDGTPYADPNAMGEAVIEAARGAGIRITLIDACYLHGGIGKSVEGVQRRFSDGSAEAWRERVDALASRYAGDEIVGVAAAIHSVRAVDPTAAALVADWAGERDAPLHAHLSEQPRENEECERAYDRSPTALLADAGALEADFTAVHATHLSDADVALLGDAAACCCLCPTTERDLADGIGGAARLRDAGASLAVGSDSQAVIDPFEEARAIELDERLASGERGLHRATDLLQAATREGHAAIGWPEAGEIATGGLADFVNVAGESVRLAGMTAESALASLVFAATAADVTNVVVGGEPIVQGGVHRDLDVAAELRRVTGAEGGTA